MKKIDHEFLENESVSKLLLKISTPISLAQLAIVTFYIVDAFFIGKWVGVLGIGAVSIIFPFVGIATAFGMLLGNGSSSIISRKLGEKEYKTINNTFFLSIAVGIVVGVIFLLISLLFKEQVIMGLGGKGDLFGVSKDYFTISLWAAPMMIMVFNLNSIVNSEGNSKKSFQFMAIATAINIALDPIFMGLMDMGIEGAALATLIAQAVWLLMLVSYFARGTGLKLNVRKFEYSKRLNIEMLVLGLPIFVRSVAGSIMLVLINNLLIFYGGELYVSIIGIILRILRFFAIPLSGMAYGLKPIVGYNYGRKNFERAKLTVTTARWYSVLIGTIALAIIFLFTKNLLMIFSEELNTPETVNIMRIVALVFPVIGIQSIAGEFFSSIGKAKEALIIGLSRQVIFLIPLILILSSLYGMYGIFIAFPFADSMSFVLSRVLIRRELNKWSLKQKS